jgi:predicted peptidase
MIQRIILLTACCFFVGSVPAQDLSSYQKKILISGGDTLRYRILLPENYRPSKKYPLIFFLHGSGERGNDNEKQLVHGAALFLQPDLRKNFPAIVVFPQCPESDRWSNYQIRDSGGKKIFTLQPALPETTSMQLLEQLIVSLRKEFRVYKKRIYVGGLSMGGMGTFEITRRNPKLFAAAFPICGATDPATAAIVKKISWWIFHGAKDDVVPPYSSIQMAEALKKVGARVRFTLYPEANHNSWDPAFAEKDLLPWLFKQHR